MKKVVITTAMIILMGLGSIIMAQSDGFFGYTDMTNRTDNYDPTSPFPGLPGQHGQIGDAVSAPVGTGVLLLAGFGVAYAMYRKKEE